MYGIDGIITSNRKRMKLTQPELAKLLEKEGINVTNKTISAWEKRTCEPSVKVFMVLCKIFGVTDIYEVCFGTNPDNPLSLLNEEGKEKANDYINLLIESGKYIKREPKVIAFPSRRIRLFRLKVSAGTGNFLDSNEYDWIDVGDEVPINADFGVQLSGDSMEPRFVDHQVVWVHQQNELRNGDIGIFCYNENAYCKKLQNDKNGVFLVSLNEKYPPMQLGGYDDLKIFGKVVG